MYCKRCGTKIDAGNRYCNSCGEEAGVQQSHPAQPHAQMYQSAAPLISNYKQHAVKTNKKAISILIYAAVGLITIIGTVLILTLVFNSVEQPATVWEILDLGEKHLRDLQYEQALEQFLKVIDIEPRNPRGYTGAAESYIGLERESDAIAILEFGLAVIGDSPSIRDMLDEIIGKNDNPDGYIDNRDPSDGFDNTDIIDDSGDTNDVEEAEAFRAELYSAYNRVLNELVVQHGIFGDNSDMRYDNWNDGYTEWFGLWRATLVDLDGDGVEELIVFYEHSDIDASHWRERPSYAVYGYDKSLSSTYLIYDSYENQMEVVYLTLFRGQDSKVYLRVNYGFRMGYAGATYYTLEGGALRAVISMSSQDEGGDNEMIYVGSDGVSYEAALQRISGYETELLFSFHGITGWGVFFDHDDDVHNNINEIINILAVYS